MTNQLIVKMALDAWNTKVKQTSELINSLTDEQLQSEVSPGRNRGIYLVGHLVAVHDMMLPLLNLGERSYATLEESFISNPDKAKPNPITAKELKEAWKKVHSTLSSQFNNVKPDDWFLKHNSVSQEDFLKEPHRNRLNIILSRTNHLAYHQGQLVFLK